MAADDFEVTEDAFLDGRLVLTQPKRGHRAGHDAILLAAATAARPGEHVIDLGAGIGAAGLALAARVPDVRVTLVELDGILVTMATGNAARNGFVERVRCVELDVGAPARAFAQAGLQPESAARLMMNPPFNDPRRHRISPDRRRRLAHAASAGNGLRVWVKTAARLLRPRGVLTLIWRADGLVEVVAALAPAFGAVAVLPVHPKPGEAAIRVLVSAVKGSRAPLSIRPGLLLNDDAGNPTAEAEAVLRSGVPLSLGPA